LISLDIKSDSVAPVWQIEAGCFFRKPGMRISPLSGRASKEVRISTQAPPDGKQIGGSHPIYFSPFYLRDDGEVFGCGFDFRMRKVELCLSTFD